MRQIVIQPNVVMTGGSFSFVVPGQGGVEYLRLDSVTLFYTASATAGARVFRLGFAAENDFLTGPVYSVNTAVIQNPSVAANYIFSPDLSPNYPPLGEVLGDETVLMPIPRIPFEKNVIVVLTMLNGAANDTITRCEARFTSGTQVELLT